MRQEVHLTPVVHFPKYYTLSVIMGGKNIKPTQTEGHIKRCLTSTPQNCQGHEKQGCH